MSDENRIRDLMHRRPTGWASEVAAFLLEPKRHVAGNGALAKALRRVNFYDEWAGEVRLYINALPRNHPQRRALLAEIRRVRPLAIKAWDDLRVQQIKAAILLQGTPANEMARA